MDEEEACGTRQAAEAVSVMGEYHKEVDSDCREPDWPRGLYRRGTSFRFRRSAGGDRLLEVFGEIPVADAVRKAQRYNFDIEDGRNPVVKARCEGTTFQRFSEEWLAVKSTSLRRKSLVRYREVVEHFRKFLLESKGSDGMPLSDLSAADAAAYVKHRGISPTMPNGKANLTDAVRNGAARRTLYSEAATLRQLFRSALQNGLMTLNPFETVRVKKPKRHEIAAKHRPLAEQEEEAFLKAAARIDDERWCKEDASYLDVYSVFLKTGLRENELRFLEWSDIDFDGGLIHVHEKDVTETRSVEISPTVADRLRRLVKGRKADDPLFRNESEAARFRGVLAIRETDALLDIKVGEVDLAARRITTTRRYRWAPKATQGDIPMCKAVREILLRLQESKRSNFVFTHRDGGSCRLQLWETVKEAQRRANIQGNLRLHDLRHTFAVRLRQRKVPLEVIMGLMRHADIKETLVYAPYDIGEGKSAIAVLDR